METGRAPRRLGDTLLILLLLFLPWLEGGGTPAAIFITHTIVLLLLGVLLWSGHRSGAVVLSLGWETPAGLAFVGACVLSFLGVDYFFGPFLTLWNVIVAALLALALLMMGPGGGIRRGQVVAAAGTAQALFALLMPVPANMTPMGTFANANHLAAYLGVAALVSVGLAIDAFRAGARARSILFGMAAAVDLFVLIRGGARGALASVLIAGVVWIAVSARRAPNRVRLALWGTLALLAVGAVVGVATRFDRFDDPYRFDRIGIWRAGLRAGLEQPVLGMGPGVFEARANRYNFPLDREMFRYSKRISSAHSTWVQAFAATGLAGVAALALFLGLLMKRLIDRSLAGSRDGVAAGALFATLACLIHALVETPFDVPAVTWTLMALIAPLIAPATSAEAPIQVAFRPGRWAATALLVTIWAGAVLIPYAAHVVFVRGLKASAPGAPAPELDVAVRLNPYNPLYPLTRARLAWRRDRPLTLPTVAAVDLDLAQARRLDPGNPEPRLMLARLHARVCFEISADAASVARAERHYREAIDLDPFDPRPHVGLALFLLARQRSAEAIESLHRAVALEPRYVGARAALIRALLDAGDRAGASAEYAALEKAVGELAGYYPRNGYEEDLMKSDPAMLAELGARLR